MNSIDPCGGPGLAFLPGKNKQEQCATRGRERTPPCLLANAISDVI